MNQKALFIDRDGTVIEEPVEDQQVDSLEKLRFIPGAIGALKKIAEANLYSFVMVTNQDGLGTDSFPEDDFWPPQNKMMDELSKNNISFNDIFIDRSFEHENAPTRKPRTGLLKTYMDGSCDLTSSWVIGDRITDIQLAANLSCRAVHFAPEGTFVPEELAAVVGLQSDDWNKIAEFLLEAGRE